MEGATGLDRARQIRDALLAAGWPEPILADSGNGAHLLYRIDLPADDGGLVQRCLGALAQRFGDGVVKVDTSVYNPARIWKLYGTLARKGDATADRPHRMARLLDVPESLAAVTHELLLKLGGEPAAASPASVMGGRKEHESFDLADWIKRHLPNASGPKSWQGSGKLWTLSTCPFNADHSGGCAFVGRLPSGAITAGCHHDSCQHWGWKELRERFAPTAAHGRGAGAKAVRVSCAELIVRLAEERFRMGCTETGEPFAVRRGGQNVALMLRGSRDALRGVLAREYRATHGRTPGAPALTDAITVLQGMAQDSEPESVALRIGAHEDGMVLDLGRADGRAVVIRPGGWEVADRSPILFRRTALTAPLPDPQRGGTLDDLRGLLNVADDSWPLLVGCLVAALFPAIPHPIVFLGGQEGTGKTTAAAFVAGLLDPCNAETHNVPRDLEAWAMAANGSWCVVVDNLSEIPLWWSDALCRTVTGDGFVKRAHYENSALAVLAFRRVVILTSIDAGALRGDLGSRGLILDLEPIPPERRRDEGELRAAYAQRRPAILGALLDLAAAVLRELPTVILAAKPRMADFARILAAMDRVLGTRALELYLAQRGRIAAEVVFGDEVGEAVAALVRELGEWSGTAGDLLKRLTPTGRRPHKWPQSPRGMAGRLKSLIAALALVGVEVTPPTDTDKTRRYLLRATARTAQSPENHHGDSVAGDPAGADVDGESPNRPSDRPAPVPTHGAETAVPGRSGDLGDSMRRLSISAPCSIATALGGSGTAQSQPSGASAGRGAASPGPRPTAVVELNGMDSAP